MDPNSRIASSMDSWTDSSTRPRFVYPSLAEPADTGGAREPYVYASERSGVHPIGGSDNQEADPAGYFPGRFFHRTEQAWSGQPFTADLSASYDPPSVSPLDAAMQMPGVFSVPEDWQSVVGISYLLLLGLC